MIRPTEDNHSLLAEEQTSPLQNEFFGQFKGFTISPKKTEAVKPTAPPMEVPPSVTRSPKSNVARTNTTLSITKTNVNKPVMRAASCKPNSINVAMHSVNSTSMAPALPPLNPGSHPRPIISSPILENSTCTAKELLSPLKNVPKMPLRPAPVVPVQEIRRPVSTSDAVPNPVVLPETTKKPLNNNALNRIASFLKSSDKKQDATDSLPRNKAKIIDKAALRKIDISNPILQTQIETSGTVVPVGKVENKPVVLRAQSMRDAGHKSRSPIPTFGSMRQPNGSKRPVSIPSGVRPKSPPPPRPPIQEIKQKEVLKIPNLPGYHKPIPQNKHHQYDDCLNKVTKITDVKSPSSDNIYSVIEESPPQTSPDSNTVTASSGSNESFGLLGEIVSEIQNRNFNSIYSTSTLARKKKEEMEKLEEGRNVDETYVNTSSIYKAPESVYSNMNNVKSSASSTSSGYIHPSAVNAPAKKPETEVQPVLPIKSDKKPSMSTFKSNDVKAVVANYQKNQIESKQSEVDEKENLKNVKSQTLTKSSKVIERQVTPPNLRTRKPSPTRGTTTNTPPKTNQKVITRTTSNSPDLVTSCSTAKKPSGGPKPPDVLGGGVKKPAVIPTKPNVPNLPKTVPKLATNKSASLKSPVDVKATDGVKPKVVKANSDLNSSNNKVISQGARTAARQHSNVASLQQKFEANKPSSVSAAKVSTAVTVKK